MGKTIININHTSGTVLKLYNGIYTYTHNGYVIKRISFADMDKTPNILEECFCDGFEYLEDYNTEKDLVNNLNNALEQKDNKYKIDFVVLKRYIKLKEVLENFSYNITLQFNGKHITSFHHLSDGIKTIDENIITFKTFEGNPNGNYGEEADKLFGKRYPTENGLLSDFGRYPFEYRKNINEIEKIFLTKEFRDVEQIGSEDEYIENGKKEILELDLRNPDMEVYKKMNSIENCIEITWN